jgi:hypothetical protein
LLITLLLLAAVVVAVTLAAAVVPVDYAQQLILLVAVDHLKRL